MADTIELHGVTWVRERDAKGRRMFTAHIGGAIYQILERADWQVWCVGETIEHIGDACHPSDGARMAKYHAQDRKG